MDNRLHRLACALFVAVAGCGASEDPEPWLTPLDAYGATATVDGTGELAARAVVQRHPSGQIVFVLRAYPIEASEVRGWDQRLEVALALADASTDDGLSLSESVPSSLTLEPAESGLGAPALTLRISQDGTFEGELMASVVSSETGVERRASLVFSGMLEAVECDAEGGATPVRVGSAVSLACTGSELGATLGSPPA